jgi:hypothetical protein
MRRLPLRSATYTTGGDQLLPILVARDRLIKFGPKFLNPRGCNSCAGWLNRTGCDGGAP